MTALQLIRELQAAVDSAGGRDLDVMATGPYGPTDDLYREPIAVETADGEARLIVV